jgi:hypothetical protein
MESLVPFLTTISISKLISHEANPVGSWIAWKELEGSGERDAVEPSIVTEEEDRAYSGTRTLKVRGEFVVIS